MRGAQCIVRIEDAFASQRDFHGTKKVGADYRVVEYWPFAKRHQGSTHHPKSPADVKIFLPERDIGEQRRGLHRRQLLYAVGHGLSKVA